MVFGIDGGHDEGLTRVILDGTVIVFNFDFVYLFFLLSVFLATYMLL